MSISGPSKVWNNGVDVDNFLYFYTHEDGYKGLHVGDTIRINDGVYNADWLIAGFDCEKSRVASNDTLYDNGYGIALVPKTNIGSSVWNSGTKTLAGAYYSSDIRNTTLPTIVTNLRSILGSHLINRNVLLSNSVDSNTYSNGYIWTNDYCTLLSGAQLGNGIATTRNKYDDGEANYKLPLFSDNESRKIGNSYWTRGVHSSPGAFYYYAWDVIENGTFNKYYTSYDNCVRPLIYIR